MTKTNVPDESLAGIFEERAEFLSRVDLQRWTHRTPNDERILRKLKGPGAKLLTGPRGSGKSTLLRASYYELLDGGDALPVYVNYSRSLALEPLFHTSPNALQTFRQWIVMRIVAATADTCADGELPISAELESAATAAKRFVSDLAAGKTPSALPNEMGPSELTDLLRSWAGELGRRRVVLLLDDAAHAFAPQQQREFFEVFRELRSRGVAPKAAVYPGITSYSPFMHVGHEAELVEAWYRPDSDGFLESMRELVARRLPHTLSGALAGREELVDYLALASFGLPRGFLVMLSEVLGVEDDDEVATTPSLRSANQAIAAQADSVRGIFNSLSAKIPRYTHFVEVGEELDRAMSRSLRDYNQKRDLSKKAVVVGFADPIGPELAKVLEMLEYAGMVRPQGTVSRGVKGVFHRYELHYAIVLTENALALGQRASAANAVTALRSRDAHSFVRTRGTALLGESFENRCTLDLEPCQECGAARVSEDARFCMSCGRPLTAASLYEELLKAPIDSLRLTTKKLEALKRDTRLRTVNDILIDEDSTEIRKASRVGPIWAARIRLYADEFVSV